MTSDVPAIFDPSLTRFRRARGRADTVRFAAGTISVEIAERLSLVKRRFERMLVAGPFAPWIAEALPDRPWLAEGRDVAMTEEALPFADGSFDCVISALSLQMVNDLSGALAQYRRALRPDGLFLGALFAGESLRELRAAWLAAEADSHGGVTPRVAPMVDLGALGGLVQRAGFALPVIDIERTTVRYANALALMREVKALGFSNTMIGRSRRPVTRALLARAAAHYPSGERASATIDVAWITAWSPDPGQPKPLKPGSAKTRLADALGAAEVVLKPR